MTQTKKKRAPGARRNRRYAKLFQIANASLTASSNEVVKLAINRLTEMFLEEEKTRRMEIEKDCAAIRRDTALIEKGKGKLPESENEPELDIDMAAFRARYGIKTEGQNQNQEEM